ncbi:hypothetical protein [Candidatus Phytoplasma meliae]|uniref:Uncharacterized protein n=1 Tax=Candidatus Phytoplasma meliae TaxID=1848402 RepID=A0ABS5CXU3_9MOLU|nr:hypothetical protein [Candidatus Phytoplasma meliae]MBP5835795.1 hypothetical protein [Candidatus Phytoplasma meliae]MBP5836194.1 hypothetical protein [Candidatus Phytoplasma meliae]
MIELTFIHKMLLLHLVVFLMNTIGAIKFYIKYYDKNKSILSFLISMLLGNVVSHGSIFMAFYLTINK